MATSFTDALKKIVPFKGKPKVGGAARTATLGTSAKVTAPAYRDHIEDILVNRTNDNSNELIDKLIRNDPDVSAALNAYLTVANTEMQILAYDENNELDVEAINEANAIITAITTRRDYTTKFRYLRDLDGINEGMRYSLLKTGAISVELIFDKLLVPFSIKFIDPTSVIWEEQKAGEYKPFQKSDGDDISLDLPTVFIQHYRKDPTKIYSHSPFTAAINTIAARQQVINDLYRIMQRVGYPRIEATIVEEVIINAAPPEIRADPKLLNEFKQQARAEIENGLNALRSDTAVVHSSAVTLNMLNKEGPKGSMDVEAIISVLNASNQAALKVMATIIGRGDSGVNTASTEARIFAKNADELNPPVACIWSQMLTFALRLTGSTSRVEVKFKKSELRPSDELEPHLAVRQSRYEMALSEGLITDQEFHLKVYGRVQPAGIEDKSGTGFKNKADIGVAADKVSPNGGPIERGLSVANPTAQKDNKLK